jgi:hypothetical protein
MQTETPTGTDRAENFRDDVADMPIRGGTIAREKALARFGGALLILGPVIAVLAYFISHNTVNPLEQRDAMVIAMIGVSVTIAGLALFLRYSLGGILRLWLARAVAERDR